MTQFAFGTGVTFAKNTTTANSTPQAFGALQGTSLDYSFNLKELYGQYNFPLTVARGQAKITGKASNAAFQARLYNDLFLGGALSSGQTIAAYQEAHNVPSVSTYIITIDPPSSGVFLNDDGVQYAATRMPLIQVASGPAVGQYSVNPSTGVYTFAAADEGVAVLISYTYTVTGQGQTIALSQSLMGVAPNFSIQLKTIYNGAAGFIMLNACVASKLSFATKIEDFTMSDLEFSAFADSAGNIGTFSFADNEG